MQAVIRLRVSVRTRRPSPAGAGTSRAPPGDGAAGLQLCLQALGLPWLLLFPGTQLWEQELKKRVLVLFTKA